MQLIRSQGVFEFYAGITKNMKLAREALYNKIQLRVKGSITISGGSTSGTVVAFSPISAIKKVELILNGSDTIVSMSGTDLYRLNYVQTMKKNELVTLANGDAQVGTAVFGSMNIDFKLLGSYVTDIALLNGKIYSDIQLRITYGTSADFITGGDRTVTINSLDVEVVSEEETAGLNKKILGIKKINTVFENTITASGDLRFEMPLGNIMYAIGIQIYDNSLPNNSLCNNVKIELNGVSIVVNAGFNALRNKMQKDYNLTFAEMFDGQLIILIDDLKNMTNSIDTRGLNTLYLTLNNNAPTGVAKAFIYPLEIIPGKKSAA